MAVFQILEEMAHTLYRERFVDFRFPGHEKVPLVGSTFGDIPQGWDVVAFTEIADVLSGGTPKTDVTAVEPYRSAHPGGVRKPVKIIVARQFSANVEIQNSSEIFTRNGSIGLIARLTASYGKPLI